MKIKVLMGILILSLLTGCTSVVETVEYIHDSGKIDNYIYDARSKIDHFDEKIDRIIRENETWPSSMIRYKLNEDNNYQSSSDMGKVQKVIYANTAIDFANPKEGEVHRPTLTIGMEIVVVDDFNENNVGISILAMGYEGFNKENVDKEKDGYDIYAFGH